MNIHDHHFRIDYLYRRRRTVSFYNSTTIIITENNLNYSNSKIVKNAAKKCREKWNTMDASLYLMIYCATKQTSPSPQHLSISASLQIIDHPAEPMTFYMYVFSRENLSMCR
jgi:hypothetical protein